MKQPDLVAGRYRLQEQIGRGGMGVVWRALDTELGRVVALKRPHVADPDDVDRLLREARIAAGVHHPGVVTLFDVVRDPSGLWLVMEYVAAPSLAAALTQRGPLDPGEVARIGAGLADALSAVHAGGVVHRDIKPSNVLLTESGAKLTDFGVARAGWADATLTATGAVIGTPAYLAPEVASGATVTSAADVFALGATLYAAVEGEPPYGSADNPLALLRRAASGEIRIPRRAGALTGPLTAALAADPAARPIAVELALMLRQIPRGAEPGAVGAVGRRSHRRPVLIGAVGATTLALAVGGAVLAGGRPDQAGARAADSPAVPATASVLGDVRTADPCALLDVADLGRFGKPRLDPALGTFDRCDAVIAAPDGARVDLAVRWVAAEPAEYHPPLSDTHCVGTIPIPGGHDVLITADLVGGSGRADLCAVVTGTAIDARRRMAAGPIPRRPPFAVDSLGTKYACSLLRPADLAAAPALRAATAAADFTGWGCVWSAGSRRFDLHFDRAPGATPGSRHTLAGHTAYSIPTADGCSVTLVNRSFVVDGVPRPEIVETSLTGDGQSHSCADALRVAGAVAANLWGAPTPTPIPGSARPHSAKPSNGAAGGEAKRRAERATRCALRSISDPSAAARCAAGAGR